MLAGVAIVQQHRFTFIGDDCVEVGDRARVEPHVLGDLAKSGVDGEIWRGHWLRREADDLKQSGKICYQLIDRRLRTADGATVTGQQPVQICPSQSVQRRDGGVDAVSGHVCPLEIVDAPHFTRAADQVAAECNGLPVYITNQGDRSPGMARRRQHTEFQSSPAINVVVGQFVGDLDRTSQSV